jgi:hypothetical protein
MGRKFSAYKVLMRNLVRKRVLEKPRRRWEDDIKMDF